MRKKLFKTTSNVNIHISYYSFRWFSNSCCMVKQKRFAQEYMKNKIKNKTKMKQCRTKAIIAAGNARRTDSFGIKREMKRNPLAGIRRR